MVPRRRDTLIVIARSANPFRISRRVRRYSVVPLALVICAWLIASAMHLHLKDDHVGLAESTACSYCMSLSGGVAPPPEHRTPEIVVSPGSIAISRDDFARDQAAPSFYLSRGPPSV
jgi:hypothetical protein